MFSCYVFLRLPAGFRFALFLVFWGLLSFAARSLRFVTLPLEHFYANHNAHNNSVGGKHQAVLPVLALSQSLVPHHAAPTTATVASLVFLVLWAFLFLVVVQSCNNDICTVVLYGHHYTTRTETSWDLLQSGRTAPSDTGLIDVH